MTSPLGQELRTAWLRTLAKWWHHYNREYLRDALRIPVIELAGAGDRLGGWDATHRRLLISPHHVEADPWTLVLDTLRHEMAHQFVDEVLKPEGESAHGAAFAQACQRLRCQPAARQKLGGAAPAHSAQEARVIRLVRKLLSLAASPHRNEAEAAMRKARHLLLEYNLDLVQEDERRDFERQTLGEVKGRHPAWELWVAMLLSDFFFVEVLWAHSYDALRDRPGTVLEIYGTRTNLAMAEYVHAFLESLLPRLWRGYREEHGLCDNRERMRFFAGVAQGFHEKLSMETRRAREEKVQETTALVWDGDRQLEAFYHYHNPRIVTRRTGGVAATDAFHHGVAEGRQVSIHRPVEQAGGFGGYLGGRNR